MVLILKPIQSSEEKENLSQINILVDSILKSDALPITLPKEAPRFGKEGAPIIIQEFSDFQCPHCQRGAKALESILMKYKDKIQVIFRGFPLDNTCNRMMERPAHPYACLLAKGAYCANEQGKFYEYYMRVFENQEKLDQDSAYSIAKDLGIQLDTFKSCVESEQTKKYIVDAVEEGLRLSVASTPTFFINGHKVEGGIHPKAWSLLVDRLLTPAK
jgi:protein-disulfide isomerase